MLTRRSIFSMPLAILFLGDLASAQVLPPGVRMYQNQRYGPHGEGNLLDLYLPPRSSTPFPVIVWIHGGGWMLGAKEHWPAICLVDKGFAVASINYRLTDEAIYPAQIHDCKAAVRWLRTNAKKLKLDPERIGAWGSSAGGHLAALLGTSSDVAELEGTQKRSAISSRVQAVCDWCGPTDLEKFSPFQASFPGQPPDCPEQIVTKLLGGPVGQRKALTARANPITYASKKSPPFLIMHGDRDELVPFAQSKLLEAALREAGAKVEFRAIPGARHEMFNDSLYAVEDFFRKALSMPAPKEEPKLVATYNHRSGDLAAMPVAFYSNGRLLTADSMHTWRLSGNRLYLCWFNPKAEPLAVWVDTCVLTKAGYRGVNQDGTGVVGEKVSGDLKERPKA